MKKKEKTDIQAAQEEEKERYTRSSSLSARPLTRDYIRIYTERVYKNTYREIYQELLFVSQALNNLKALARRIPLLLYAPLLRLY